LISNISWRFILYGKYFKTACNPLSIGELSVGKIATINKIQQRILMIKYL